jgi:hypothetical protein
MLPPPTELAGTQDNAPVLPQQFQLDAIDCPDVPSRYIAVAEVKFPVSPYFVHNDETVVF